MSHCARRLAVVTLPVLLLPIHLHSAPARPSPINLTHALSLVDSVTINGEVIAFIYVYAEAPDYRPVEASGEGVACVDDAGRFMEVLEHEIINGDRETLVPIARTLTRFLLYMGRDDGLWYNFILSDGEINRTHDNSVADFGWWAVRGLRGLASAYNIFKREPGDTLLLKRIKKQILTSDQQIQGILKRYPARVKTSLGQRPAWLVRDAPDLNSELLIALTKLQGTGDFDYGAAIERIAEGIMEYQYRVPNHELHGMYLCWNNVWHNWGNNQAYALLEAFRVTGDSSLVESVKMWADSFVPFLIERDFPRSVTVTPEVDYSVTSMPQIAYGMTSIYRGMKSLAEITGDDVYVQRSEEVFEWFRGRNVAKTPLYQPETGRCFDGIDPSYSVNTNSGAESTIESLLAIQKRGFF